MEELKIISSADSADKKISKYLISLPDTVHHIEAVIIRASERKTLCLSTQVGCARRCLFCNTGMNGFIRSLTSEEIIAQYSLLSEREGNISNIVYMGMGEPLDNYENVMESYRFFTDILRIAPKRITISTAGISDKINTLSESNFKGNLAVSLHSCTEETRSMLMPVNRAFPLRVLKESVKRYCRIKNRKVLFEYILMKDINDRDEDIDMLVMFCSDLNCKVNLMNFNKWPGTEIEPCSEKRAEYFYKTLQKRGLTVIFRKNSGQEILGACGQLSFKKQESLT